jgi:hypothetical protein
MVKNMVLPLKIGKKGGSERVKSGQKPYFTPKLTQNRGPKRSSGTVGPKTSKTQKDKGF